MATKKPTPKKAIPKKPVPRKRPSMDAAVAKAMANDKVTEKVVVKSPKPVTVVPVIVDEHTNHPKAALVVESRSIKHDVAKPPPVKAPPPVESHVKKISVHDLAQMASLTQPNHGAAPVGSQARMEQDRAQAQATPWDSDQQFVRDHLVHTTVKTPDTPPVNVNPSAYTLAAREPLQSATVPDRAVESPLLKVDVPGDRKKPLDFNVVKEAMRKVNPFGR